MIHKWGDGELEALLRSGEVDIVLGGGGALFSARRARIPWLEINHDRGHALCGYEGALTLLEQVSRAFASPLWTQVRQPHGKMDYKRLPRSPGRRWRFWKTGLPSGRTGRGWYGKIADPRACRAAHDGTPYRNSSHSKAPILIAKGRLSNLN